MKRIQKWSALLMAVTLLFTLAAPAALAAESTVTIKTTEDLAELSRNCTLDTWSQGKTVIMIAHRLSSVIDADRIFVLRDGEICQSGTHKELEKADGLYAHMWKEYNQSVCWKVGA